MSVGRILGSRINGIRGSYEFSEKYEEIGKVRRPRACRKCIIVLLALALLPQTYTSCALLATRSCSTLMHRRMPTGNLRRSHRFVTQSQVITSRPVLQ